MALSETKWCEFVNYGMVEIDVSHIDIGQLDGNGDATSCITINTGEEPAALTVAEARRVVRDLNAAIKLVSSKEGK